jgi:hypothetical protein
MSQKIHLTIKGTQNENYIQIEANFDSKKQAEDFILQQPITLNIDKVLFSNKTLSILDV